MIGIWEASDVSVRAALLIDWRNDYDHNWVLIRYWKGKIMISKPQKKKGKKKNSSRALENWVFSRSEQINSHAYVSLFPFYVYLQFSLLIVNYNLYFLFINVSDLIMYASPLQWEK